MKVTKRPGAKVKTVWSGSVAGLVDLNTLSGGYPGDGLYRLRDSLGFSYLVFHVKGNQDFGGCFVDGNNPTIDYANIDTGEKAGIRRTDTVANTVTLRTLVEIQKVEF